MMVSSIYLSLSSNLGDRKTNLKRALGRLQEKGILLLRVKNDETKGGFYQFVDSAGNHYFGVGIRICLE